MRNFAPQYADVIARGIGSNEVGDAVAVDVGHHNGSGCIARRKEKSALEAAVAVT